LTPAEIEAAARALVVARAVAGDVEITMPVIYPSGRAVQVIVTVQGGQYVIHDGGGGSLYLTQHGVRFTRKLARRLAEMAQRYGCDYIDGRLSTRASPDQIAVAIALVANASRMIGDQAADLAAKRSSEFTERVASTLREIAGHRLAERFEFHGASGKTYHVANALLDARGREPVAFVEAVPTPSTVPHRVTEFLDIRDQNSAIALATIYDDAVDWDSASIFLMRRVAAAVPFARAREHFAAVLAA
jgi:hypothetical protein